MNAVAWIAVLVLAVTVVAVVAWWAGQRRRTRRLQDRFGPEYDRTVETTGKRSEAEAELEERQERVEALEIRPLDAPAREQFRERWRVVQALFVDDPAGAVEDADNLIGEVMRARGYPVGDFEQRAADISVNHPHVVDHYRTAHGIAARQAGGRANTEQLRQAMVHFRALFADLLDLPSDDPLDASAPTATDPTRGRPAAAEVAADPPIGTTARRSTAERVTSRADTEGTPTMTDTTTETNATTERTPASGELAGPVESERQVAVSAPAVADPLGPERLGSAAAPVGERPSGAVTPAARPGGTDAALFDETATHDLQQRWQGVQVAFVDEPRKAVEQADQLVDEVLRQLQDGFARERSDLERAWSGGSEASTEDLRQAIRRYRSFFNRLLAI